MQANAEMETRMLEEQLEHARKDIVALKRKQEFLLSGGALNAAALHASQVNYLNAFPHAGAS